METNHICRHKAKLDGTEIEWMGAVVPQAVSLAAKGSQLICGKQEPKSTRAASEF